MYGTVKEDLLKDIENIKESGLYKNERVITSKQGAVISTTSQNERESTPKGKVKLTAPGMYGETFIMPVVHTFMQQYPDVEVVMSLSNQQENLVEGGFDLAIRLGHLKDSSLDKAMDR